MSTSSHPVNFANELYHPKAKMTSNGTKPKQWILGDKFEQKMPHHAGIKALWETKWKFPVRFLLGFRSRPGHQTTPRLTRFNSARKVYIRSTMANTKTLNRYLSS